MTKEDKMKDDIIEEKVAEENRPEGQKKESESIYDILDYVELISSEVFELINEQKHKESAEKLEKALFRTKKIIYLLQNYGKDDLKNIAKKLQKIKEKLTILKRYYEIMTSIESESLTNSFKGIKEGSIVNRKT
jgi:NTP pyrophosphatase (non-canonical NTP hydrolase)